jgi:hypothetical protein
VDFSGQSSRLLMLEEMGNTIKTAATEVNQSVLTQMYSNKQRFLNTAKNTSGKQLKDKTAASKTTFNYSLVAEQLKSKRSILV